MRISLVEDDLKIADFVIKGLKSAGYAVDHAPDGEAGLDLALSESYDAIIVDIMLPKRDGLSLIRELRRQKVNTPALILSAKASVDDRVKGLETGADDYLTKPFAGCPPGAGAHPLCDDRAWHHSSDRTVHGKLCPDHRCLSDRFSDDDGCSHRSGHRGRLVYGPPGGFRCGNDRPHGPEYLRGKS